MSRTRAVLCVSVLSFALSACGMGPGTPLIVALKRDQSQLTGNVPKPKGYGPPVSTGNSSGLINPKDRKETEAYLETLAPRQ